MSLHNTGAGKKAVNRTHTGIRLASITQIIAAADKRKFAAILRAGCHSIYRASLQIDGLSRVCASQVPYQQRILIMTT